PPLGARAILIDDFRPILRNISGKILPDGTLADDASVALKRLRREIERQQRRIQDSLERFLRSHRTEGVLQEEFVTIRNDRFVVPIIAGQQRHVDGVIHGSSGTGHTLFVEPIESIELNNDLVRLAEQESAEVHRILREITDHLRSAAGSIDVTVRAMGELEFFFAKARFAVKFGGVIPKFCPSTERRLLLRDARHPLLEDVLARQ
ncbi:MAG: endonuclease MutS2, partial [bacterium]|nr:endonuclease MutS2 [bacterium]